MAKEKNYTDKQKAFLQALGSNEVKGNVRKAMDIAGYSRTTSIKDMIDMLADEMAKIATSILAAHGPRAAFEMIDILDDPTKQGADNSLKVATQILDRIGVSKKESTLEVKTSESPIFILPQKVRIVRDEEVDDGTDE